MCRLKKIARSVNIDYTSLVEKYLYGLNIFNNLVLISSYIKAEILLDRFGFDICCILESYILTGLLLLLFLKLCNSLLFHHQEIFRLYIQDI